MRRAFSLVELLVVVAIIASLVGLLLPAIGKVRDQARLVTCGGNQRQLASAAIAYAADTGMLPIMDMQAGGWGDPNPSHWTATLAPYLDYTWTFPDTTLANQAAKVYRCPLDGGTAPVWMNMGLAMRGYWVSYGINQNTRVGNNGRSLGALPVPVDRFMLFADLNSRTQYGDGYPGQISGFDWYTMTSFRHPQGPTAGFFQEIGTTSYWNTYQVNGLSSCVFADGHVQPLRPRDFINHANWGGQ